MNQSKALEHLRMMLLLGTVERNQRSGFLPVRMRGPGRALGGRVDPKVAFGHWET